MNKGIRGWGNLKLPSLSPFDIGLYLFSFLSPIFFLGNWDLNMIQGIFFCFGTFTLLGLSFFCKREREYSFKGLGVIILLSLLSLFVHAFRFPLSKGITAGFINYCLLSEGFIFVLCGVLLYYLVISYKQNFNIAYSILLINIINFVFIILQLNGIYPIWQNNGTIFGVMGTRSQLCLFSVISIPILFKLRKLLVFIPILITVFSNSFSGVMALFITFFIFFIIRQDWNLILILLPIVLIFIGINHIELYERLLIRFDIWKVVLKEISQHPFLGYGFDNSLHFNMIHMDRMGWVYRQNDFLNVIRDLGIFFILPILYKITDIIHYKKNYLWIAGFILIFGCFFQTNFYFARVAGIGIVILSLLEVDNATKKLC